MGAKTITITDADFASTILKSTKPALVDFWATWCGPCRIIAPIVEEIAAEYDGKVVVAKLDVDSSRETATTYGIQAIPTLLLIKDGKVVDRIVGMTDKSRLKARLDALL